MTLVLVPPRPPPRPRTIGRAIAAARGNVRRQADGAGAELDSTRPTAVQTLGGAVADAAKPDCLGPNAGGSLLSIPLIAISALRGTCK